jgi:hypothetical protein
LAKKQKRTETYKPVTSRQLTRKEREKKTQKIVIIISSVVLLVAIAMAVYGFYDSQYKPYHETLIEVNDTKVDMDYYLTTMKMYLNRSEAGNVETIARAIPGAIINNLLIIQRAPDLGFTVSQDEIKKELADEGIPDEPAYRDLYASGVLTQMLETDYFGKTLPESVDQVKVMAIVVDTPGMAQTVLDGLDINKQFFELVDTFGIERITNERSGNLGWLPRGLIERVLGYEDASVLEKTAFSLEPGEISQPVYDPNITKNAGFWVLKITEKSDPDTVHVYGILVGSEAEAQEVRAKLEAGEDFSSLVAQYSQDENSKLDNGDLGWMRRGYTPNMVMEQVFDLETGQISDPIHDVTAVTKGGYWIIKAIEKESNRPLDTEIRTQLINEDMMKWLLEETETSNIENYLTDTQQKWAINKAVSEVDIKGK